MDHAPPQGEMSIAASTRAGQKQAMRLKDKPLRTSCGLRKARVAKQAK